MINGNERGRMQYAPTEKQKTENGKRKTGNKKFVIRNS